MTERKKAADAAVPDAERRDWTWDEIEKDPRLERARSEMLVTFFTYAAYVALLFIVMYSLSREERGIASFWLGLPSYLTAVCLIAAGAVIVTAFIAKKCFREDSLDADTPEEADAGKETK